MHEFLSNYEMNQTTWVTLSSLMIIGIYFKFRRFWSVRNLDLLALIALSPGLLMLYYSSEPAAAAHDAAALERMGFIWLFSVGAFFLVRLLLDLLMVRRPLLEPNLSASGLTFAGAALLVFMIANVLTAKLTVSDVQGARRMDELLDREESPAELAALSQQPPGCPLFQAFAAYSSKTFPTDETPPPKEYQRAQVRHLTIGITAILAHLAVVLGVVLIGYRHFDNVHTGVAVACLYLMLPYTAQATPLVGHVVPAALLVWAVEAYRRPVLAGFLLGFAAGLIFYPLFLLPLWCSFYWRRGLVRFLIGFCLAMALSHRLAGVDLRRHGVVPGRVAADVQLHRAGRGGSTERFLEVSRPGLPHSGRRGVRGAVRRPGLVAGAEEPRHAVELLGRGDARRRSSGTSTTAACTWLGICRCCC